MRTTAVIWLKLLAILLPLLRAEDSLKSALNAVNRRQRDLSVYKGFDYDNYGFPRSRESENLAFLKPTHYNDEDHDDLEKALVDYLDTRGLLNLDDNIGERSSLFRERVEKDRAQQRKNMAEVLLTKLYNEETEDNERDDKQIHNYYKYPDETDDTRSAYKNKISYNMLGWNSMGMRKRSRYFQPDGPSESLYLLNYAPRDEIFKRLEEEENSESEYNWNLYPKNRRMSKYFNPPVNKRFPVSKRSENSATHKDLTVTHYRKRSPNKEVTKTDPKVEKELTSIFNSKNKIDKMKYEKTSTAAIIIGNVTTQKPKQKGDTREVVPISMHTEKSLEIKKKSINWSDYFGLDRRKKFDNENENDWFIKSYQKAVSIAKKRSDYPLNFFHDQDSKIKVDVANTQDTRNTSESIKIKDMDDKLKNIEESIVDDALKFTGAHEDVVDSKEIQEVKDKIIARLAAAYSLEKMRRALRDYKESLERGRETNVFNENNEFLSEEKRIAIPRKQAIDDRREVDENNNIKCTDNDENCVEQNYKPPAELLDESLWPIGECPIIEEACNEVLSVMGNNGRMFNRACSMYQVCHLCGDNTYYYPNWQCNTLFMLKADDICNENAECKRNARETLKYIIQVNRSLRNEERGACDLECPNN